MEVENKLHWQLDVTFKEDDCRCNIGYSAQNFCYAKAVCSKFNQARTD
ncbi:MAG: hypothetical protein HOP07_18355 [Bacteriovoracaceae bacterium]|nr:hypothetical protein [Bacteriovoracaceae bacterium]